MSIRLTAIVNGVEYTIDSVALTTGYNTETARLNIHKYNAGKITAERLLATKDDLKKHRLGGKGRFTVKELAKITGKDQSTILKRLKRYKEGEILARDVMSRDNIGCGTTIDPGSEAKPIDNNDSSPGWWERKHLGRPTTVPAGRSTGASYRFSF